MKYFTELTLLPSLEIPLHFIWQKLYQQIHLVLAENKIAENSSKVGVSFPEYNADEFLLGTKLRLFAADEQTLRALQCEKWLERLRDYVHVNGIKPVPENVTEYACFRHIKMKGSKEKLARRRAKRKKETIQQALAYFADYKEPQSKLPYINMVSQTNGQHFRLFIEKQSVAQPQSGYFSCYGLSHTVTVPLF
ncbi:type I-F CRISPR-associated endoribonuclease Cas6/Csy4 [uncultured Desulfuromusa sp.]|uniref:type I-F CRISPR-associated endoribonuclease Cas6/Csy4 n=1 Tax=uncultured Desulfuromusa sp. TaxID=219183 RepID=UPI002AA83605|nr:type I-F CRISPR-associated endoribonuclease Cas6/Csy4 [uncultured Desulfuromusa sp.]